MSKLAFNQNLWLNSIGEVFLVTLKIGSIGGRVHTFVQEGMLDVNWILCGVHLNLGVVWEGLTEDCRVSHHRIRVEVYLLSLLLIRGAAEKLSLKRAQGLVNKSSGSKIRGN